MSYHTLWTTLVFMHAVILSGLMKEGGEIPWATILSGGLSMWLASLAFIPIPSFRFKCGHPPGKAPFQHGYGIAGDDRRRCCRTYTLLDLCSLELADPAEGIDRNRRGGLLIAANTSDYAWFQYLIGKIQTLGKKCKPALHLPYLFYFMKHSYTFYLFLQPFILSYLPSIYNLKLETFSTKKL